jgi:hypothetical protein
MLSLLIGLYCSMCIDEVFCNDHINICINDLHKCIKELNDLKYKESRWTEVPDQKMSYASFKECIR